MSERYIYTIIGLFVGAAVDIILDLLATVIEKTSFAEGFTNSSVYWLIALAICGLMFGFWLSGRVDIRSKSSDLKSTLENNDDISITRLKALFSLGKLRGRGITLSDILLIGSKLDIKNENTRRR